MKQAYRDQRAIPKEQLIDGAYYRGECRNAEEARWNAKEQQFYHWRYKFGWNFIETIKCQEDDDIFDVFIPLEKLEGPTGKEINFS